jgi:hypothetical protein
MAKGTQPVVRVGLSTRCSYNQTNKIMGASANDIEAEAHTCLQLIVRVCMFGGEKLPACSPGLHNVAVVIMQISILSRLLPGKGYSCRIIDVHTALVGVRGVCGKAKQNCNISKVVIAISHPDQWGF